MKEQANRYNMEFTEETEEQILRVVDTIKEEQKLLQSFTTQFNKMQNDLERKADRYIQLKCYKAGIDFVDFMKNMEQEEKNRHNKMSKTMVNLNHSLKLVKFKDSKSNVRNSMPIN